MDVRLSQSNKQYATTERENEKLISTARRGSGGEKAGEL